MSVYARTTPDVSLMASLGQAALVFGRLDQALRGHPLAPAALHRMRLECVRRQAAVDGLAINAWHLAIVLEDLPLRLGDHDRGGVFDAARHALEQYRWMVDPDFDQEGAVQEAETFLVRQDAMRGPLLQAGQALHAWLNQGHGRAPMRAAIVRHWGRSCLHLPLPLTGAAALAAETPWDRGQWLPCFMEALAAEAEEGLRILSRLEHAWRQARGVLAGRRRNSRAAAALDIIAGAPLISSLTLADRLGMAPKNALAMLDSFVSAGIVVEVTKRTARRLFGLAGLVPMREDVLPPRRARRRQFATPSEAPAPCEAMDTVERPPFTPLERWRPDFGDLEAAMAQADRAILNTRRKLVRAAGG